MTDDHRIYLENLVTATGPQTKVIDLRTALQSKFNLDRTAARKIIFEWLRYYPFKKTHI
jgi:lantibiotic modifying enzyme